MDEGLSRAVVKVFVELHAQGLIYKDKRLVNWDPKFQTAISDLEVVQVEKRGTLHVESGDPEKPFDAKALAKVLDRDPERAPLLLPLPAEGRSVEAHRRRDHASRDHARRHRRCRASRG